MLRQLGLVFAVLALLAMAGGQWAVVRTVAWAGMLQDYTRHTGSVLTAVAQTFDGQHPCDLCRRIAGAKAKEPRETPAAPRGKDGTRLQALIHASDQPVFVPVADRITVAPATPPDRPGRTEQPPTPPPRRGIFAA